MFWAIEYGDGGRDVEGWEEGSGWGESCEDPVIFGSEKGVGADDEGCGGAVEGVQSCEYRGGRVEWVFGGGVLFWEGIAGGLESADWVN